MIGSSAKPSMRLELHPGEVVRVAVDAQALEAGEDLLEHDPGLEAGQVGAQAEVRAAGAEGHVVVRVAGEVEPVGVG